ncbi:B12-binding domain-containing radical SAM protein [Noviherbaspirillum sp. ST9]|uniref:B12-binding domain-containing radical SAM protein n=1 Tax=Noviherbaspirillum sp. ST9 TaxID=3401606 RepID=UPI003B587A46
MTTPVVLLRIDRAARRHTTHPRHLHPALDLNYAQAAIEVASGRTVPLLDGWLTPFDVQAFAGAALALKPRIAVIRAVTWCLEESIAVARILRHAGVTTIAVGQQVLHVARCPQPGWLEAFDLAIPGEPEQAVPQLVADIERGTSLAILQMRWPANGRGPVEQVVDPDSLPAPRFSTTESTAYPFPFPLRGVVADRWAYILTAWGCPRPCLHCSAIVRKSVGRPLRARSLDSVLDEVARCADAGAQAIAFEDDSLFVHRKRFMQLANGMQRRGITLPWMANARPDELDEERILAARDSGAVLLKIGVDTGAPRLIEKLGKTTDGDVWMEAVESSFASLHAEGIGSVALFMFGLPGETQADAEATRALAMRLPADYLQVQLYQPYPDVPWWESLNLQQSPKPDYHYGAHGHPLGELSFAELDRLQRQLYRQFYLRPSFIARHLRHGWRWYLGGGAARVAGILHFLGKRADKAVDCQHQQHRDQHRSHLHLDQVRHVQD